MDRARQLTHPGWALNLVHAGRLEEGERVAVVVDEDLVEEGAQLAAAVKDAGGEPRLELWAGERPFAKPPAQVLGAVTAADLTFFLHHRPIGAEAGARAALYEAATSASGREIFMGFIDGALLRGELSGPSPALEDAARELLAQVEGAETIRVEGAAGTDLTLNVAGRRWLTDALPLERGSFANFPGGEVYVAPLRAGADGVLVADLTVPYTVDGLLPEPVTVQFERGRVVAIEGGEAARLLRKLVDDAGEGADTIAELGIGLNPSVRPRGNPLLDEKAANTAHVAIGGNRAHGGDVDAAIHVDCIFSGPRVWADGRPVRLP